MRPAFDHRHPGTPAGHWTPLIEQLPYADGVSAHDHLVVFAAHPDDETLGAGGLIAAAAEVGARVTVVLATAGEASHPRSPTHSRGRLAEVRRAEAHDAAATLAPAARLIQLGLPDGRLAEDRDGLQASLVEAAAGATVIAAPWRYDGHPDHDACGEAAARVATSNGARLLEYPIWGWHWGVPGESGPLSGAGWVALPTRQSAARRKATATALYVSQHTALSAAAGDEPVLAPGMLDHFSGRVEVFRSGDRIDLPVDYFDRLYRQRDDPWSLSSGFYEQRKRDLLLAALPRPRFRRAFEPGCALGLLTVELAERCDEVLAWDISSAAVAATAERTQGQPSVRMRAADVPGSWPDGLFDLIVIGELGYYLADVERLARRIRDSLTPDGVVAAVHWRHPVPGYPSSAEWVHTVLGRTLCSLVTHVERDFLLDVWSRDGRSVARRQGLIE